MEKLNNFQRKETARWLLSMSQGAALGGVGTLFIPGIGERVGLAGGAISMFLALVLYLFAMYVGKEVKDGK